MKRISLIVIDPQVGFCSPQGSLGAHYGERELVHIQQTIPSIQAAIQGSERCHLVRSEYHVAQFTGGDETHPLANLCVLSKNDDCELIDAFLDVSFDSTSIKYQPSALGVDTFLSAVEADLKSGIEHFVFCGFLLEHCVQATAIDIAHAITELGATFYVAADLTASRDAKYKNGTVQATADMLERSNVHYCNWSKIAS